MIQLFFFFFFQAEDGIRDGRVTGVQTCALPISAKQWLVDRSDDPAYGARLLRRQVSKSIGDELAKLLLAGEIGDGDAILADAGPDGLRFTRETPAVVA